MTNKDNVTPIKKEGNAFLSGLFSGIKTFFKNIWSQLKKVVATLNENALITSLGAILLFWAMMSEAVAGVLLLIIVMSTPMILLWVIMEKIEEKSHVKV